MALGIGSLILVILVLFRGIGIHRILLLHSGEERRLRKGKPHVFRAVMLFGVAVFLLLFLHLVEVIGWATVLLKMGLIERAHDAIYFCANAYTTLGLGALDLDPKWRNISPIIGISGLFTFAWTTSALVGVVGAHNRLIDQLHEEREKEKELRSELATKIGELRGQEGVAEKAKETAAHEQMAGAGLWGRWGIWQGEKKKVLGMREGELIEIAELYRQERAEEETLGPGEEEKSCSEKK